MTKTGRERLADYIDRSRLKQYELADILRIHETTLSQLLHGKRRPGLDIALRIEAETGVPALSWSENPRGGSGKRRRAKDRKRQLGKELSDVA